MKEGLGLILVALLATGGTLSISHAEDLSPFDSEPMQVMPRGQEECHSLRGGPGSRAKRNRPCAILETRDVEGLGTARLSSVETEAPDGWMFVLSIRGKDKLTRVSRPIVFSGSGGGGEYYRVRRVTPTMTSLMLGSSRVIAIDFEVETQHEQWEDDEPPRFEIDATYHHHTIALCGMSDKTTVWHCARFSVGRLEDACVASLSDTGMLSVTCDDATQTKDFRIDFDALGEEAQERERRAERAAQEKIVQARDERRTLDAVPANGRKCRLEIQRRFALSGDIDSAALAGNSRLAEAKAKQRDTAANRICEAARELRAAIFIYQSRKLPDAASAIANEHRDCLAACP